MSALLDMRMILAVGESTKTAKQFNLDHPLLNADLGIVGSMHVPPPGWEVPPQMEGWASWLQEEVGATEMVFLAAMAHHRLGSIHPFLDGNGRTARLIMNLILMRDGYPPTIICPRQPAANTIAC